jgi:hypothetical protein
MLEQLTSSRVNLGFTRKPKIFISQNLSITQIFFDTVYSVQIEKTEKIHLCHLTDVLNRSVPGEIIWLVISSNCTYQSIGRYYNTRFL